MARNGFTLIELMLGVFLTSFVVLAVVAVFFPISDALKKQRAWSDLGQAGRLVSCLLVRSVHQADAVMPSTDKVLVLRRGQQVLRMEVKVSQRIDDQGRRVRGLYLKENTLPSVEWVASVVSMRLRYAYCAKQQACVWLSADRIERWEQVRGVDVALRLANRVGEAYPWHFQVALRKPESAHG